MPAPTAKKWEYRIKVLAENHRDWSAPQIREALLANVKAWDERNEDVPAERTVRRIRTHHVGDDEEARAPYQYLVWPDSFDAGLLPRASVRALLDEIAYWNQRKNGLRRTVRWARWYWRLYEAAGVASSLDPEPVVAAMRLAASTLSALEVSGELTRERYRTLELWLAYRGWTEDADGDSYGKEEYERAVKANGGEPWENSLGSWAGSTDEQMNWTYAEFHGVTFAEARETRRDSLRIEKVEWTPEGSSASTILFDRLAGAAETNP